MAKKDEKFLYRMIAQRNGVRITADTGTEVTFDEAKEMAEKEILMSLEGFDRYVILPISTEERWEEKCINFCPRCGKDVSDYQLGDHDVFDCDECGAGVNASIY